MTLAIYAAVTKSQKNMKQFTMATGRGSEAEYLVFHRRITVAGDVQGQVLLRPSFEGLIEGFDYLDLKMRMLKTSVQHIFEKTWFLNQVE